MAGLTFDQLDALRTASLGFEPTAEEVAEVRGQFMEGVSAHPIFRQYIQHLARGTEDHRVRNVEAWQALGERLMASLLLAQVGQGTVMAPQLESKPEQGISYALRTALAIPYLWRSDIVELAEASPLPKHVISRELLAAPMMFWSFETAFEIADTGLEFDWILVMDEGEQITTMHSISDNQSRSRVEIQAGGIRYGSVWPDDFDDPDALAFVLKLSGFLASPYVDSSGSRLSRPDRRRLARGGLPLADQEEQIRVVKLRRSVSPRKSSEEGDEEVEWHHKWWVSGHYRAQWYPSLAAHKVIWIAPHLKGPDDKPLLEKIYDVAR